MIAASTNASNLRPAAPECLQATPAGELLEGMVIRRTQSGSLTEAAEEVQHAEPQAQQQEVRSIML